MAKFKSVPVYSYNDLNDRADFHNPIYLKKYLINHLQLYAGNVIKEEALKEYCSKGLITQSQCRNKAGIDMIFCVKLFDLVWLVNRSKKT